MMNISTFINMASKIPSPGQLEGLVTFMKEDEKLRFFTESYRKTGNKSYKHDAPLFAVACIFEGGKGKDNIRSLTHLSLVDFDHITEKPDDGTLHSLKERICHDAHTLLCYVTMSGNGLRVIYRYEGDDYPAAFAMGNDYYAHLIGKESDPLCKNITRLSGLAYDPEVYFNPEAKAFSAEEISHFHSATLKTAQKKKKQERIADYYEQIVKPKLESEKIRYEPGNHNQYVMRVGYMMAKKRYDRKEATQWAIRQFPEYDDVEQVFKSCYDNTSHPQKAKAETGKIPYATVDEIKDFLDGHIKLRFNLITLRYEYLKGKWRILQDRNLNTLWSNMSLTARVSKSDMINVIESDYTPPYNPFTDYLENLPPWQEGDKDYIAELAATVKMKGDPVMPFCEALRKWLVAMIAGWIDEGAVNNVILVFIGRQGAYKTTWFNYLLPPELKQYFYTKANARRMTKDDIIALSQYALICYEELDTMSPSELNQLKAVVTMQYTNERAAYGHYAEQRKHINTFCGTGNNPEFLSDLTGNRRWLPYEIESILSPREHPFNYEGIYAQAYALYKSDFRYWFTDEEIEKQNRHNRAFEAPRLEQELVDLYFRKPTEAETGEFVSIARAMQIISCNISQKLNSSKLGKAFNDLGFEKMRTKHSRGYRAIVRTAEEIKAYQVSVCINPPQCDDDAPF